MRTIKFRALRDGTWHVLDLTNCQRWDAALLRTMRDSVVEFDTPLCEYTGLKADGSPDYEDAKVVIEDMTLGLYWLGSNIHVDQGFQSCWSSIDYEMQWDLATFEVIGNIHENPEVLPKAVV